MPTDHTETQPAPNISTEHQAPGDARRPSDTLDRDQDEGEANAKTEVEDRPGMSSVTPDDYPDGQKGGQTPA
ncbi:MAG: hypothetical protein V4659_08195 [Pseudomonadota bacterium]